MASKASLLENRMRMFMVQTKWIRRNREGAMKLHTERIRTIKPGIINNSPFLLRHPLPAKAADLEQVLSGTAQYLKNYKKEMARDGKKWHPPYSLRKMNQTVRSRDIRKTDMAMAKMIKWIKTDYSMYAPFAKHKYLIKGQAPYKRAPRKPVINKRLARAMKWAMKPKSKKKEVKKPEQKGWFFSSKETKVEEPPKSISTVTDVEAGTDPMLNILKQVQEAGDPTF
ncbi:unnamed protein product [Sphagnum jensenii]|uniref:Uncharacterized protein n=1 Tax=Sphagnum jensenii TaxID=128206 RepID=A0ABP0WWP9_9BRYO